MKKLNHNTRWPIIIPLLFLTLALTAQESVTKDFHKEYTPGANTTLEISNRYGDIIVESWDKNQIVIDVKVTVEMSNREKAEKFLSYITVEFSESPDLISAKTVIDDKFNFSGWGNSRKFSIDYTVKMPVNTALTLANKYGNTNINELHGLVNLDIKYGNLDAGKLTRENVKPLSSLNLAYGKGSIDEAGWFNITIRYCGNMTINKSQALVLDSRYSKLTLGQTSSVVGDSRYDNLRIESINNLDLDNGYTEVNIGKLAKKLEYNGSYGSFSVDQIPAGFESLKVETRYMGVRLGIANDASYNLEAKVSYGGLKYNEENFRNQRRVVENNSSEISGIVGKEESPSSRVNVSSSYGTIKLF